jgi:hypothetical protein
MNLTFSVRELARHVFRLKPRTANLLPTGGGSRGIAEIDQVSREFPPGWSGSERISPRDWPSM